MVLDRALSGISLPQAGPPGPHLIAVRASRTIRGIGAVQQMVLHC